jgi:hypothetical protein
MHRLPKLVLSASAAALLVTSFAAPADARRYRHWDYDRGVDFGDLVVGAIIIGGIAVLASEIGKARDKDGTVFGRDRDRRGGNTESAAIDACSDAAERRAAESGRSARVSDIGRVERSGDQFRVRGTLEYRSYGDWGGREDRREIRDSTRFTCTYSFGRVDNLWVDDGYAWR